MKTDLNVTVKVTTKLGTNLYIPQNYPWISLFNKDIKNFINVCEWSIVLL